MNAHLEFGIQPLGKVFDELLTKVAPIPRSSFLKGMMKVLPRNFRNVNGIAPEVIEVIGNQREAAFFTDVMVCVDSDADVPAAILRQWDYFIDPQGVN